MGEVVNVIVAVAVIVFIVRWATAGKESPAANPSPASVLGFRPKTVSVEMVETIHTMFPDTPSDNIRYDLLRTGSVQLTTNKILERGFLPPPPPAYYTIYPRAVESNNDAPRVLDIHANDDASTSTESKEKESLITRYHLEDRVATSSSAEVKAPEEAGGKAIWEDTPEKREASLRERKARMILAARERMLKQQAALTSPGS